MIFSFTCVFLGWPVKRYGYRVVLIAGNLTAVLGLVLSSLAVNLYMLFFTYGILLGTSAGSHFNTESKGSYRLIVTFIILLISYYFCLKVSDFKETSLQYNRIYVPSLPVSHIREYFYAMSRTRLQVTPTSLIKIP